MEFPLSVLDQSPIVATATPQDAVAATIALAARADALGYRRYWLAEHHSSGGLADASPEVLLGRLTASTSRIRLGSGGIMLPHYSAFKVAEAFRMLDALAPGRIDLGVGRAPGGTGLASVALQSGDPALFPQQIVDAIGYLDGTLDPASPFSRLHAMPAGPTTPEVWILGSSEYGGLLAAQLGLPYAYAHFIGGENPAIARAYRAHFRPSERCAEPHVMLALAAVVAPTDADADVLALPVLLQRLRRLRGMSGPVPSLEEAQAYPWTPLERHEVALTRRIVTGSPATARARIDALVAEYEADEAMIVTIAPTYADRLRSYELLAEAFTPAVR